MRSPGRRRGMAAMCESAGLAEITADYFVLPALRICALHPDDPSASRRCRLARPISRALCQNPRLKHDRNHHGPYLLIDAERQLVIAKRLPEVLAYLGFAPNSREPGLPGSRQARWAVVMADLYETGCGDVIAPGVEIEEAGIAIVAKPLLVVSSRI